jgi:hypothetical protein
MGFLDSILHKEHHPQLDPGSAAARRLDPHRAHLESFVAKMKDRLELVPASDAVYIFVGKPPGAFGIAWLTPDGAEHNLKTLIQKRGLAPTSAQGIAESLRHIYEANRQAERYETTIAGRAVTVTASDQFAADLGALLHQVEG